MMSNDNKYAQLDEWIRELIDGTLEDDKLELFQRQISEDPDSLKHYIEYSTMLSLLCHSFAGLPNPKAEGSDQWQEDVWKLLSENEKTAPGVKIEKIVPEPQANIAEKGEVIPITHEISKGFRFVALAATFTLVFLLANLYFFPNLEPPIVAILTGTTNAIWADEAYEADLNSDLRAGLRELKKGFVEITFDSGAEVTIEAPARFNLETINQIHLDYGKLYAVVNTQATNFKVNTPGSSMVDIGTEFGVLVDRSGRTELHVFKGEVILYGGTKELKERSRSVVTTGQARFVAENSSEISELKIQEEAFVRMIPSSYELIVKESAPKNYWRFGGKNGFLEDLMNPDSSEGRVSGQVDIEKGPYVSGNGKYVLAAKFNGDGAHIAVPERTTRAGGGRYTYMMWMKLDELSEQDILTTFDENQVFRDSRCMRLVRNGTLSISNMTYTKKKEEVTSEIKLEKGKWYHIAVTKMTGHTKKLYINGENRGVHDLSTPPKSSGGMVGNIYLGGIKYESELFAYRPFKGAISEFTLHIRALSESEIKRIYESAHVK